MLFLYSQNINYINLVLNLTLLNNSHKPHLILEHYHTDIALYLIYRYFLRISVNIYNVKIKY